MKRHRDALAIQAGACNPLAITNSLLTAMRECSDSAAIRADPAVRLIVHQLAHLMKLAEFDADLLAYARAVTACETAA